MRSDIRISIVVCCYNSCGRLKETIMHLGLLQIPDDVNAELLIVDNASTDDTAAMAREWWDEMGSARISFKAIAEPKPGLTNARMAGIATSKGELILFCDDDNHLSADYVVQLLRIFDANHEIGIVGGLALPKFSVEGRRWLKDFFKSMAIGPQAPDDGFVTWVYGAGMSIRRSVFDEINNRGIKILLSGRAKNKHTSGEDSEICNLARFLGHKVYYNSRMVLQHDTPPHRLTRKFYLRSNMPAMYETAYLFILGSLVENPKLLSRQLYGRQIFQAINAMVNAAPRMVLGQHQFFSFLGFYGNIEIVIWLLLNYRTYKKTYQKIIANLFDAANS